MIDIDVYTYDILRYFNKQIHVSGIHKTEKSIIPMFDIEVLSQTI